MSSPQVTWDTPQSAPPQVQWDDERGAGSAIKQDVESMGKSLLMGPVGPLIHGWDELKSGLSTGKSIEQREDEQRKASGRSLPYRMIAPVGEAIGVNVSGMEDAAEKGDVAGVAGHTAVPLAQAAAPLAAEGLVRGARTAGPKIGEFGRSVQAKAPTVGNVAGVGSAAYAGAKTALEGHPAYAPVAAGAAYHYAPKVVTPIVRGAGRGISAVGDYFSPEPVYPGASLPEKPPIYPGAPLPEHPGVFPGAALPEHPGVFPGAHLPEKPAAEVLNPAIASPSRSLPGQISPEVTRVQPIPARKGLALPEKATGGTIASPGEPVPEPIQASTVPRRYQPDIQIGLPDRLEDQAVIQRDREDLAAHGRSALREERAPADEARAMIDSSKRERAAEFAAKQAYEKVMNPPVKYTKTVTPKAKVAPPTPPQDLADTLQRSIEQARAARARKGER